MVSITKAIRIPFIILVTAALTWVVAVGVNTPFITPTTSADTPDFITNITHHETDEFVFGEDEPRYAMGGRLQVDEGEVASITVGFSESPFTGSPWTVRLMSDDGSGGLNGYEVAGIQRNVESPTEVAFHVERPGVYFYELTQDAEPQGNTTLFVEFTGVVRP